ncbi:MAG: hypothetical protein A3F72_05935 [Bacteroidetes bacterium RIFCSPLOWO2_12_FULL_35_15]|nr:MAG: hypothetical protein A3F72_05935 [Bacteroidetes bacterium RIFCSPLOWO2_12_FULL_35_15]
MFKKLLKKINHNEKIIFIVEDNEVYAKLLQTFIQNHFPNVKEIKIFRIGEMCLMEINRNPSIIIMDYFLNSKYEEANNGLEIIKRIKMLKPKTKIIVLSIQEKFNVAIEAIKKYDCIYIQKNQEAFNKVEHFINEILNRDIPPVFEPWN